MPDFKLGPPQPALAGETVYAVLSRDGVTLAIAPMGVVDADGNASGSVPTGIDAGWLVVTVRRQSGVEPAPGTDWLVAEGVIDWPGDPPPPPDPPEFSRTTFNVAPGGRIGFARVFSDPK